MAHPVPLFSLTYASRTSESLHEAALTALLRKSRAYNQQTRISGLLLYAHGRFLQVLEGDEAEVRALYARIQTDPRHHEVRLLASGPTKVRSFPDWRMGFAATDENTLGEITGFLPLPGAPGLAVHPPAALGQLLRDFARGQAQDH